MTQRSISDDSRADLDGILDTLLPFAEDQLRKRGGFTPFAASVDLDGEISLTMPHDDTHETTIPDLLALVEEGFRKKAQENSIRASGICYDGRLRSIEGGQPQDAVLIDLEHRLGDAVQIARPYSKKFLRGIVFAEIMALPIESKIFVMNSTDAA